MTLRARGKRRIPNVRDVVRATTALRPERLRDRLGLDVTLASETFQITGSFKFRAAYNVAASVPHPHILAASSGNFGQALACACRMLRKECTVVMPANSAQVKIDAVRSYGAVVDLVDTDRVSRADRVATLAAEFPDAYVASAFDDPLVIEGNSTLGEEIAIWESPPEVVVAPVGGGGLTSGLVTGLRLSGCRARVIGAEPLLANDAARSLREGRIVSNEREPPTVADGARTLSLGQCNWEILSKGLATVVEVREELIGEAVRLLFADANLKAEPTGALGLAAILAAPELFRDQSVCCVVSGGNVDPFVYASLLMGGRLDG